MNRALHALGLGADADERAIKRAYAAKLKTTRPDSDPEGFQALNEAYRAALIWAQSRPTEEDAPSTASVIPVALMDTVAGELEPQPGLSCDTGGDSDAIERRDLDEARIDAPEMRANEAADIDIAAPVEAPEEPVRFDLDAFFETCAALAVRSRDGELLAWLNAQPILWSLEHKGQIGHWLLRYLQEQRPPIEARRFDVMADFFGLLDLNSGYDAYLIHRLRHRLHLSWEVQSEQLRALAQRAGMDGSSVAADIRQTRRVLSQIRRPMRTAQVLFAGLMPMYPSAVRSFLHRLDFGNLDDLPPPIDPQQVAFWDAAGDRSRLSAPRLMIGATRCLAYALAGVAIVLLVKAMTPGIAVDPVIALKTGATLLAALLAGWSTWIGGQACLEWQCLPESEDVRFGRLRWALIPLLALSAFALQWALQWDLAASVLSLWLLLLAWHRYRRRNGYLFGFVQRRPIWSAVGIALLLGPGLALLDSSPYAVIGGLCALAVALWFADLRKQRVAPES
jgi:hypothetical protein